ncbi:MAG: metallophosphoesterase [Clostridiales bacterium]|nr:metallophosphoesterase [Clostridiales bacterium]
MIYVMSDIHGDYFHFSQMTEKIRLSSEDRLYILGDAVDKGKENLRVLRRIYRSENICFIKGNHEYLCERYLTGTISGDIWDACGGRNTREEVDGLTTEERMKLRDYLRGLPIYRKLEAGGKEYFLTHSGFYADYEIRDPKTDLVDIEASVLAAVEADQERYLFSDDIHYIPASIQFDKRIIVGHYPTMFLPDFKRARIYHGRKYIDIDTGNERRREGGRLSCMRLEDGQEFYI